MRGKRGGRINYLRNFILFFQEQAEREREREMEKRFDERKIQLHKSQLFTKEKWNSDTVMNILYLTIENYLSVQKNLVDIVDSGFLSLIIDNPVQQVSERNISVMKRYIEGTRLLLLPVFHQDHWSLLAYLPEAKQWLSCDSLGNLHEKRIIQIIAQFHILGIVPHDNHKYIPLSPILPNQYSNYECGTYIVFYAFVLVYAMKKLLTNQIVSFIRCDEYLKRLENDLTHTTDAKRLEFLEQLEIVLNLY